MGFLAQRHEAGQQLADAAVVDVAVLIAGHVVGGVVGVDAGHVLEVLLLLQVQQVVDGGDDAVGVVLLVTLGDLDQVAVQLLGVLGEVLDEVHVAGHAGLHIQSAAAEHVVAGLNVRQYLRRQGEGLLQLLGQLVGLKGVLADGAEIIHAHGVDVADEDHGAVGGTLGALDVSQSSLVWKQITCSGWALK